MTEQAAAKAAAKPNEQREAQKGNNMKTLYFEGAGWSGAEISKATIGNCRIRTAFHLDDGRRVYLEITGSEITKHSAKDIFQWRYTGFVDTAHYITDDKDNDDTNRYPVKGNGKMEHFEYTEAAILKYVNSLGASFEGIMVLPNLGGYRVFKGDYKPGEDIHYYGDEFKYNPEAVRRREAVYAEIYAIEKAELEEDLNTRSGRFVHSPSGTTYPNFSLWVDEFDPGMLHLLRHFNRHNRHWTIRTDISPELTEIMATMTEVPLGKYGC